MKYSQYETAAAGVWEDLKLRDPGLCLVLDLEQCSAGLCACTQDGQPRLRREFSAEQHDLWAETVQALEGVGGSGVRSWLDGHLEDVNRSMTNYLRAERMMDGPCLRMEGAEVSCSAVEQAAAGVLKRLNALLDQVEEQVSEEDQEDMNIVLTGRGASLYLLEFCVREALSGDALLPDERFRNDQLHTDPGRLTELGMARLAERDKKKELSHQVELMVCDREGGERSIVLADRSVPLSEKKEKRYSEPVYIAAGDVLRVNVDGKVKEIKIPYSIAPMDSDLVETAAGLKDGALCLFIRRSLIRTRVYHAALA